MDDSQILDVWGAGRADPATRPQLMLAAAHPELPAADLAGLPVGRCNELLLRDRQMTFGDQLEGDVVCPDCGDRLEIAVAVPDLLAAPDAPRGSESTTRVGEVEVRFRPPTHTDLLAASDTEDAEAATEVLLARCVVAASRDQGQGGEPVPVGELQAEVVAALDAALADLDPYADLRLATVCAICGHAFDVAVDPCGLYWAELTEHARRLLVDVHRLAAAYGWTEREILGIDPARREAYLELVG